MLKIYKYRFISVIALGLLMNGCDLHFEPFLENEQYVFSIQGVLDASKDTQSVRISPIRQSFRQGSDAMDAVVTLEHIESGEVVVMSDSLRQYADDSWAWNFYTDMPILPGGTYRLTATRSDGRFSRVTVQVPEAVPEPVITCHCRIIPDRLDYIMIYLESAKDVVIAEATYYYTAREVRDIFGNVTPAITNTRSHPVSQLSNHLVPPLPKPERLIWVTVENDLNELASDLGRSRSSMNFEVLIDFQFVVAGPGWPDTEGKSIEEMALAPENTNVENGLGRLAGIISMDNYKLRYNYPCPPVGTPVCGWRDTE